MTHATQTPASQPPPRKRHIPRWARWVLGGTGAFIILIIVVSVAAGGGNKQHATTAAAPATSSAPASPVAPAATTAPAMFGLAPSTTVDVTGDLGSDQGGSVTAASVQLTTRPADPSFGSSPANGTFVIVTVTATAARGKTLDVNALDWYAKVSGQHFDYSSGNAMEAIDSSKMLTAATLRSGESTTGQISFDVPAGHGEIVYAPNYNGGPLASWKF